MDALKFRLQSYFLLQQLTKEQASTLSQKRTIVTFYNLVVDCTEFQHPGYNQIIQQYKNTQISRPFYGREHSFNAELLVCHFTIGKLKDSPQEQQGKAFYEGIRTSKKNVQHENAMAKLDFSKPILEEFKKLNAQQINLMTQIPKNFKNTDNIRFKEGRLKNFVFQQNFWVTFSVSTAYFIAIMFWILSNFNVTEVVKQFPLVLFGIVKWTFLQYIFHRFLYHNKMKSLNDIRSHLIHHSFPNLRRKVAMGIIKTTIKLIIVAILYSLFLKPFSIALIYAGLIGAMIVYDCMHYYCHFGPETNIKIIRYLRINHLKHHYRDLDRFFGVTNTFWDRIFGTGQSAKLKK